MKRFVVIILTLLVLALGLYFFDQYWIHRYDSLIAREAAAHRIDSDLVWSITYEETYFRPWLNGKNGEIGLMQVTPAVARAWATETEHGIGAAGLRDDVGVERLQRVARRQHPVVAPEEQVQRGPQIRLRSFATIPRAPGSSADARREAPDNRRCGPRHCCSA